MEKELDINQLLSELEKEYTELEGFLYDDIDNVTTDRAIERKHWLKNKIDEIKAQILVETVAEA